jgi:2-hydroxy-3-keto-5-methylthiopentenyl-1-phosphate phosphatase
MFATAQTICSPSSLPIDVFVDFDGTIAPDDPTDSLFARFADPYWLEIEAEWQQGLITSSEAMARQVRLIRATPEDVSEFLADVRIDPDFPEFVRLCRSHGARVTVVSDGMDLLVGTALKYAGLDLPFFANKLEWQGEDRWALRFPYMRSDCRVRMGNCKCAHGQFMSPGINVMVGDGRSDFCIAERCDLVLAKGKLITHCRQNNVDHVPISSFAEANAAMRQWLARNPGRPKRSGTGAQLELSA